MWSRINNPRLLIAVSVCLLLLSGCGFRPLYGDSALGGQAGPEGYFRLVEVAPIKEREGQMLRNNLMDDMYSHGRPAFPEYALQVTSLNERRVGLGIRKDAVATRAQMSVTAQYAMVHIPSGETLFTRSAQSINSYNILDSQFTTKVTQSDARDRALRDISHQITRDVALYFQRNPTGPVIEASADSDVQNVIQSVNEGELDTGGQNLNRTPEVIPEYK